MPETLLDSELGAFIERDGDTISVVNPVNPTTYRVSANISDFIDAIEQVLDFDTADTDGSGPKGTTVVTEIGDVQVCIDPHVGPFREGEDAQVGLVDETQTPTHHGWVLRSELEQLLEDLTVEA